MMRPVRRASLLVAFYMLASAATRPGYLGLCAYLSANPDAATMLLAVAPISLENADIGITVTSRIRYTVTSRASGAPLFNDVVVAECSRYTFSAGERPQHSTECSMRKNIEPQKALLLQVTE